MKSDSGGFLVHDDGEVQESGTVGGGAVENVGWFGFERFCSCLGSLGYLGNKVVESALVDGVETVLNVGQGWGYLQGIGLGRWLLGGGVKGVCEVKNAEKAGNHRWGRLIAGGGVR